jgi:hypothetical protein
MTDIEVFDDFPAKYHAYARREDRWIRGDWQLLPWIGLQAPTPDGRQASVITALGRWKILDNLRRSLTAPAIIVLLVLGWTVLPGVPWVWSLAALAVLAVPLGLQIIESLLGLIAGASASAVIRQSRLAIRATARQVALSAVFLANQAFIALDAIARTLYRLFISRKHMLEWETAAAAEARLGSGLLSFVVTMVWAIVVAITIGVVVAVNPSADRGCTMAFGLAVFFVGPIWLVALCQIAIRPSRPAIEWNCAELRERPGASSRRLSPTKIIGCRRTTFKKTPRGPSRIAPRQRTRACSYCRRFRRTTSGTSRCRC